MDLAYLRDFLAALRDSGVASFSNYNVSVSFRGESPTVSQLTWPPVTFNDATNDVQRSRVGELVKDGWHNPNLWPQQGGKILKLDGSLE